jgi:hypothetical protein
MAQGLLAGLEALALHHLLADHQLIILAVALVVKSLLVGLLFLEVTEAAVALQQLLATVVMEARTLVVAVLALIL